MQGHTNRDGKSGDVEMIPRDVFTSGGEKSAILTYQDNQKKVHAF